MLTASQVAKYFLALSDPAKEDGLSNLKLQKMLYLAQGHFLAEKHTPLFDDKIKAWKDGPAVPQVWHEYKKNKSDDIPQYNDLDIESIDESYREVLDAVYSIYRRFSAWELRELTHDHEIYASARAEGASNEITRERIQDFFANNMPSIFIDNEDEFLGEIALERLSDKTEEYIPLNEIL